MMASGTYDVMDDKEFQRTILYDANLSDKTKDTYRKALVKFTGVIGKPFHEIVEEIKSKQNDRIVDDAIIRYDPNDSICNDYITKYVNHCISKGNKDSTIHINEQHIRTIMRKSGIILPDVKMKVAKTHAKKTILSRDDIRYILDKSNIHHKALITFACATGFRVADLLKFTVEDFMEATRDYHDIYEVDEFIEEAPYDMMGFWKIMPQKTQRLGLECRVCNTPESSNYILDSLTERKDFLESQGLKVDFDDALFSSRNTKYKGHYSETSLSPLFSRKNKLLEEHRKKELMQQYKERRISRREFKDLMEHIPKFHAHACRHFFTTTVRAYTTNRDISLIMEGHTSPYAMDKYYVGVSEDMFNDDTIKKTYSGIVDYLSFSNQVDLDRYFELMETESKYKKSIEKTKELEEEYGKLSNLLENMVSNHEDSVWNRL